MAEQDVLPPWLERIDQALARHDRRGGFLLPMAEYRPELAAVIAERLGLGLCDFRAEVMAPRGWQAARLPLIALDQAIAQRLDERGLVMQNVEALLATCPLERRKAWLAQFMADPWPAPVLLPLALFAADVAPSAARRIDLSAELLPQSNLLIRLLAARS
jgi:hypothetical protein